MLLDLHLGKRMCCLKPSITIASLKLAASSSFGLFNVEVAVPCDDSAGVQYYNVS